MLQINYYYFSMEDEVGTTRKRSRSHMMKFVEDDDISKYILHGAYIK